MKYPLFWPWLLGSFLAVSSGYALMRCLPVPEWAVLTVTESKEPQSDRAARFLPPKLPVPVRVPVADPVQEKQPDQPVPILSPPGLSTQALRAAIGRGALPTSLLLSAFVEQSGSGELRVEGRLRESRMLGGWLQDWFSDAIRDSLSTAEDEPAVAHLGRLKARLFATVPLVYERDAGTLSDLKAGRLNCESGSLAVMFAALQADLDAAPNARLVFVHTPAHVQPGLVIDDVLFRVEATALDKATGQTSLADARNMRIVDARRALAIAATNPDPDSWLWTELLRLDATTPKLGGAAMRVPRRLLLPASLDGPRPPPGERPMAVTAKVDSPRGPWGEDERLMSAMLQQATQRNSTQRGSTQRGSTPPIESPECTVQGTRDADDRRRLCAWLDSCSLGWKAAEFAVVGAQLKLIEVDGTRWGDCGQTPQVATTRSRLRAARL